ncbi:MAG: SDR family oxidoreductase [Pseudomonadota bacterium]|nr:SDR family oxidoreductase [Pseudomonadota bacterium]
MNVLVCGSTGCVGNAVVRALRWRGHRVVEGHRPSTTTADELLATMPVDFMIPRSPHDWAARLREARIDAIVNCVGILIPEGKESFARIHSEGPIELFEGARAAGVGRVVQVSALNPGSDASRRPADEPEYQRSKRRADEFLLASDLDAAVVRPSLIYGPGSVSARLFATLASLPLIGLPGAGAQQVQPIHVFEVAEAIAVLVEKTGCVRGSYELGGRQAMSYRQMLAEYRDALGFGDALWLPVPTPLLRVSAWLAELVPQKALSRDTLRMLEAGNTTERNAAGVLLGRAPASLRDGLRVTAPLPALDLRVHLAPPIEFGLRAALAFLWLYTAAISALWPNESGAVALLASCGFSGDAGVAALVFSCLLNSALGVATLLRPSPTLYALQLATVGGYTLTAAINVPLLTLDHCGPLAKNLLVAAVVGVLWLATASTPRRRPRGSADPLPSLGPSLLQVLPAEPRMS